MDHKPQPRYPFEFHEADALEFPLECVDAIQVIRCAGGTAAPALRASDE